MKSKQANVVILDVPLRGSGFQAKDSSYPFIPNSLISNVQVVPSVTTS